MTQKTYLAEPHVLNGHVTITALLAGEKPVVRLAQTWFHPQGGGQRADTGSIGPARVISVQHAEEKTTVDHVVDTLDGLVVGQTYPFTIDATARAQNAASHSAGHLIAAVVEQDMPALQAVSGHHWPGESRVEFIARAPAVLDDNTSAQVQAFLSDKLAAVIAANWPVTMEGDPYTNRSMRYGDTPAVPCGGTHVAQLRDIGTIIIKSVNKKADRLRVSYDIEIGK